MHMWFPRLRLFEGRPQFLVPEAQLIVSNQICPYEYLRHSSWPRLILLNVQIEAGVAFPPKRPIHVYAPTVFFIFGVCSDEIDAHPLRQIPYFSHHNSQAGFPSPLPRWYFKSLGLYWFCLLPCHCSWATGEDTVHLKALKYFWLCPILLYLSPCQIFAPFRPWEESIRCHFFVPTNVGT